MSILTIPSGLKEHILLANETHKMHKKQKEDKKLRLEQERSNLVFQNYVNCINSLLAEIKESDSVRCIEFKIGDGIDNLTLQDIFNISKHPNYRTLKDELETVNINLSFNANMCQTTFNVKMTFNPGSLEQCIEIV